MARRSLAIRNATLTTRTCREKFSVLIPDEKQNTRLVNSNTFSNLKLANFHNKDGKHPHPCSPGRGFRNSFIPIQG